MSNSIALVDISSQCFVLNFLLLATTFINFQTRNHLKIPTLATSLCNKEMTYIQFTVPFSIMTAHEL